MSDCIAAQEQMIMMRLIDVVFLPDIPDEVVEAAHTIMRYVGDQKRRRLSDERKIKVFESDAALGSYPFPSQEV